MTKDDFECSFDRVVVEFDYGEGRTRAIVYENEVPWLLHPAHLMEDAERKIREDSMAPPPQCVEPVVRFTFFHSQNNNHMMAILERQARLKDAKK